MRLYSKLALDGIRKNRQLYLPYIITCIGMVMMNYILYFLQKSPIVAGIEGGYTVQHMLSLGIGVMAFFACIFLFYTNSFLMRRRKKEFGLYNILGLGKRHICVLICWETGFIYLISVALGLLAGVIFSKLAELGLLAVMKADTGFQLSMSWEAVVHTLLIFSVIFLLLLLNALWQVRFSKAITLLRSEQQGEKAPKANWLFAVLGVILLAAAYTIAVKLNNPVSALQWFFVAVLLVIAATYLLMIAGSVALCRMLQKNKTYYYKANHFISVSSMVYRMKRNGAGLAAICILATMVLVMVSSTAAMYAGMEDSVHERYPRELNMSLQLENDSQFSIQNVELLRGDIEKLAEAHGTELQNVMEYRTAALAGVMDNGTLEVDPSKTNVYQNQDFSSVYQLFFVPLEDFNTVMGTEKTLGEGEALLFTNRQYETLSSVSFHRGPSYTIKENLKECFSNGEMAMTIVPTMILVVDDVPEAVESLVDESGRPLYFYKWNFGFDTDLNKTDEEAFCEDISSTMKQSLLDGTRDFGGFSSLESRSRERAEFMALYGGLFYLGILLSIVFLAAAVLIIYYKQISEGYEDQRRFEIMQKVGVTKKEIRKSINSQMLTVFFLPILGAGLHICFAFPIIEKLLLIFNLQNKNLFIATTLVSFLIFAAFYVVVYRITSNAYYRIVSHSKQ